MWDWSGGLLATVNKWLLNVNLHIAIFTVKHQLKHFFWWFAECFNENVKIVDLIKTQPLYFLVFALLFEEINNLHKKLLHTEVLLCFVVHLLYSNTCCCTLVVLCCLFDLNVNFIFFLWTENFIFLQNCIQLDYLADIFEKIDVWNLALQGDNV